MMQASLELIAKIWQEESIETILFFHTSNNTGMKGKIVKHRFTDPLVAAGYLLMMLYVNAGAIAFTNRDRPP